MPTPAHSGWLYRGDAREPVVRADSSQADLYRAVAAALASPDPQAAMPVDPWDAVHTLAVIDAARVSAARGPGRDRADPRPLTARSGGGEAARLEALLVHAARRRRA